MNPRPIQPPDLEMRVRILLEHGKTRLIFGLNSPTGVVGYSHWEFAGPTLQVSPEEFQRDLLQKIEQLGEDRDTDGTLLLQEEIERKLVSLGRELWRQLFPPELRSAYKDIRSAVRSWLIVSDEPWIPWELVRPYEGSPEPIDDDFLALQFELTRWLAGDKAPSRDVAVRTVLAVQTARDLPHASQEARFFKELAKSAPGLQDITPSVSSANEVLDLLEASTSELIHVVGHGKTPENRPDEAGIPFLDGSVLRPTDIQGPLAAHIAKTRPLVFLNVCSGSRQGWSVTSLGGWAARWVTVCGAGAFIAPMWSVRDSVAATFAQVFYDALIQGKTLGKAALEARRGVRQAHPRSPSALAYMVYGHPDMRVTFGGEAEVGDSSPAVRQSSNVAPTSSPDYRVSEEVQVLPVRGASGRALPVGSSGLPSNRLKLKRSFTDRDRDDFVEQSFELIAQFFEASLIGLERENAGVGTKFRRVDANTFESSIFVQGERKDACRISMGSTDLGDIAYSPAGRGYGNSYNEVLTAVIEGNSLGFRSLLGSVFKPNRELMTAEDAAEHLWEMLISRLR